ncbi:MAG TPA: hypothetical protein VD866_04775 [Urbifossiella sp.]|nr:hypothetical protein [Urbifossiella sp.]
MPLSVPCPGCREPLDVDDEYRAWKVRCPRCGTEFVPEEPPQADSPHRRPHDHGDDVGFDDRPRRRRRSRYDREDHTAAAEDVYGPGVYMEVVGWLGTLGSLLLAFLFLLVGLEPQPGQQNPRPEDVIAAFLLCGCFGVLGVGVHVVMIVGGRHLRRMSSRSWAMTAAVLALLTIGVLQMPAGIWALAVMNRPYVRDAFDDHARDGGPPDDDD